MGHGQPGPCASQAAIPAVPVRHTVVVGDNSARRESGAFILHGASPARYGHWLRSVVSSVEGSGGRRAWSSSMRGMSGPRAITWSHARSGGGATWRRRKQPWRPGPTLVGPWSNGPWIWVAVGAGDRPPEPPQAGRSPGGRSGRSNTRLRQVLGWEPVIPLGEGLRRTYLWIDSQVAARLAPRPGDAAELASSARARR